MSRFQIVKMMQIIKIGFLGLIGAEAMDTARPGESDEDFAKRLAFLRRLKNESKVPQNRFGVKILMRIRILRLTTKEFHGEWI